jgi:hypothetical protein
MNTHTHEDQSTRPFYERALRFVVIGTFTILLLYVKAVAILLKWGIEGVNKIPGGGKRTAE